LSRNLDNQTQAQHHLDRALAALDANLPERADTHIDQCLQLDPGNLLARVAQARVALANNRPQQALTALDGADLYDSGGRDCPDIAMLRAQTLIRCNLDDMARAELLRLTEQLPDDVRPHRMLAELFICGEMLDDAIEQMRHVVRLEPTNSVARRTLAELLQERDPEASSYLLLHDDAAASNPVAQLLAARLCRKAGRLRDAQELYDVLLEDRPDDPTVWIDAGELADAMGADTLAIARLERAVELASSDRSTAIASLARAHMHAGRLATAGRCWWRSARYRQDNVHAWAGLLVCSLACGKSTLAGRARKTLDLHWSKTEHRAAIADIWPDACCGVVVRQNICTDATPTPQIASPLNDLLAGAAEAFERYGNEQPARADTCYHLALCRDALGQKDDATRAVQAAIRINPSYAAAQDLAEQLRAA